LYSAVINPEVSEIEFSTSEIQSTARFVISSGDFVGLKSNPIIFHNEAGEIIKFQLNTGHVEIQDLEGLANRLNDGSLLGTIDDFAKTTLRDLGLVASTNGSALSFTQRYSVSKKIIDAQILGEPSIKFSDAPVSSSEVYVFTRDGRQISGPALSIDKASEIITSQNGFFDEAEYRADYLETGYLSVDRQQNSVSKNYYFRVPTSGAENKFFSTASTANSLNSNGFDLWIGDQATGKVEQVISVDPGLIAVDISHEVAQNLSKHGFNTKLSNLNKLSVSGTPSNLSFSIRNTDGTYSDIYVNLLSDDVSPLVAQLNLVSGKTGVWAEISNDKQSIILNQSEGADIVLADIQSSSAAQGSAAIVLQKLSSDGNLISLEGAKKNLLNGDSIRVSGELEISSSRKFSYGLSKYASQNSPDLLTAVEGEQTGFTNITQTLAGDQKSIEFNFLPDLLDTSIDGFSAKSVVADTILYTKIDDFLVETELSSLPSTDSTAVSNFIVGALRDDASAKLVAELIFNAPIAGEIDHFDIEFEGQKYSGRISFPNTQLDQLLKNAEITLDGPETGRFSMALKSNIDGSYTLDLGAVGGVPTAETLIISETSAINTSQVMTFVASNEDAVALSEASMAIFGVEGIYEDGKFIITTDTTSILKLSAELPEGSELNISSVRATVLDGSLSLYDLSGNNIDAEFSVASNVKNYIKLSNLPNEELIVIFEGANTSNFSTRFTSATNNTNLPPDLSLRVMDGILGIYEVFDAKTQQSLATRVANDVGEFSALGYAFRVDGSVRANDSFQLTQISDSQANSDNILRMLKLNKFDSNTGQGEFNQIFKEMISDIGMRVKSSEITKQATEAAQQAILELKDEFSGVNLDTEAANLMEQQQAYQALARVLSTARDLLNTLMEVI
jgi:flagellar hook-associated protein 1 FlgK